MTQTYYYVLASQQFFAEEPFDEVIKERQRSYQEQGKAIDFWVVPDPAFLATPSFEGVRRQCPQPAMAVVSTNAQFITWLKLRLEYVYTGNFDAPTEAIPDPLASLSTVH